ncbi:MAG TPA: GNAT family N-acetyltransferase [Anaerolineaceae bacterium]|nr:GNAT family N-acetyltransferase [Anaerolineaceae bacterium]
MKTPISIVQTLPEQQWRDFVDQHPHGNIFHTPEMFEVFRQTRNHVPEIWAAVRGDQVLALLLPVRIHLVAGLLRPLTTRAIAYSSALYKQDQEGRDGLEKLLQAYGNSVKKSALFIELRNSTDTNDIQPILEKCNYSFEEHLNYLVNIDLPVDQVMNNLHSSLRKKINQALRKNQFEIIEVREETQIKSVFSILKKTYSNAHVPLADSSLFEASFNILYPKNMIRILLGRVDGHDIATSVSLLYKDVIYGWYGGFDRNYSAYLSNDLMIWDSLKWGSEHAFHIFDFGGAGKPDEEYGPRKFKAKFGGKLVNYGRNINVYSPRRLQVSKLGYEVFRHLSLKKSIRR